MNSSKERPPRERGAHLPPPAHSVQSESRLTRRGSWYLSPGSRGGFVKRVKTNSETAFVLRLVEIIGFGSAWRAKLLLNRFRQRASSSSSGSAGASTHCCEYLHGEHALSPGTLGKCPPPASRRTSGFGGDDCQEVSVNSDARAMPKLFVLYGGKIRARRKRAPH